MPYLGAFVCLTAPFSCLQGFPYDWRVAPFNLNGTVASLRTLIEDTVAANGHSRAIVVSHSMGGLLVQAFFESESRS